MDETIRLRKGLGVFWRSREILQVGLDPRAGVVIEGLTRSEQDFVAMLTHPATPQELRLLARRHRLDPERAERILAMLEGAGVLENATPDLSDACVRIENLDPLGVGIGLTLAESGVGSIVFDDPSPVLPCDHPALSRHRGQRRATAFLTALRLVNPNVGTDGTPLLAVVSGSHLVDPQRTYALCDDGIPHLLAWAEDVDACVGPLVEPGVGSCARCAYHARCQADPAWANLAAQAIRAPTIDVPAAARDVACGLAASAIMGFLDGSGNSLRDVQWRVPLGAQEPYRVAMPAHPECGCTRLRGGRRRPDEARRVREPSRGSLAHLANSRTT